MVVSVTKNRECLGKLGEYYLEWREKSPLGQWYLDRHLNESEREPGRSQGKSVHVKGTAIARPQRWEHACCP